MRSMHPPADAGQLCAELLADFAQAQQRLYSPQVEAVLHTPKAVVHEFPDAQRAEKVALTAGANCLRKHIEDLTGQPLTVTESRSVLICTLEVVFRALDAAKGSAR